jgi:hypothetical protein
VRPIILFGISSAKEKLKGVKAYIIRNEIILKLSSIKKFNQIYLK